MMPQARASVLQIHPYIPGVSAVAGATRVIKLSSNEGAFGPPSGVAPALARLADRLHRYPDGGATALRAAIGARFGLDPDRIVCGAGSDDLLFLLCHIYGGPGTSLIMTEHGFSIYEIAGQLSGSRVIKVPEHQLTTDVDAILAAVADDTSLVFIANPNNPTGTVLPASETARLRAGLPDHVLLVLDAAYAEYLDRPDYDPGVTLVDAGHNTVMTRTFSKMFGIGGLRLGWAYAPPDVIKNLNRGRSPFNVSLAAHEAGLAALAEPGWVERCRAHNTAERARITGTLRQLGIGTTASEANFVLADFTSPERADAADAHLRQNGIIVRRVGGYGLPRCLRITVGLAEENTALLDALSDYARAGS